MNVQSKYLIIVIFILLNINSVFADIDSYMLNNGMSTQVDVKDTRELKVNFIPVDYVTDISSFIGSAEKNIEFINIKCLIKKKKNHAFL